LRKKDLISLFEKLKNILINQILTLFTLFIAIKKSVLFPEKSATSRDSFYAEAFCAGFQPKLISAHKLCEIYIQNNSDKSFNSIIKDVNNKFNNLEIGKLLRAR
jgi:hypothetical protein